MVKYFHANCIAATIPRNRDCVVPENIRTPTTEGISLRTPPPTSVDFPFLQGNDDPPPPTVPDCPQVSFTKKRTFCSSLTVNVFMNLPLCASLRFVFHFHGHINVDRINAISVFVNAILYTSQTFNHKIKAKRRW